MTDQGEIKPKRGIGCLGVLLIIILVLALIAGSIYFFLPKILSSMISGGTVSTLLPAGIQKNTQNLRDLISDNIDQLEEYGLSTDDAVQIVSSADFNTIEDCLEDIHKSSITNSTNLIDTVSKYIDLSAADLNKIKSNYYTEFKEGELTQLITDITDSPLMSRLNFRVAKETIIEILKSKE
ncbi:MAG: hypothetical protein KAR21_06960 [Spirochaetales bacterium]|nr:hypothetical protein [Spirochaetales bacterium]